MGREGHESGGGGFLASLYLTWVFDQGWCVGFAGTVLTDMEDGQGRGRRARLLQRIWDQAGPHKRPATLPSGAAVGRHGPPFGRPSVRVMLDHDKPSPRRNRESIYGIWHGQNVAHGANRSG